MSFPGEAAPAVSVLMVAHNAGAWLGPAVRSVLGQTWPSLELMLIDNASTDGSVEGLPRDDPRLRIRRMPANLGQVGGWRAGLEHCRGGWLAMMDADDLALPGRLEAQMRFLREHPGIDVVTTLADEIDEHDRRRGPAFTLIAEDEIRAYAEFDMPVRFNTALLSRSFAARVGFAPDFSWAGDYEFLLRALAVGRVACLPEVHYLYRIHTGSMTGHGRARQILSASFARLRHAAGQRRSGEVLASEAEERRWLDRSDLDSVAVHRLFARRTLAARLPTLGVFHARRARSPFWLARALAQGIAVEPARFGFLVRLALWGPVRALRVRSTVLR
jgi:glycosyltransferase involved in cell wall biosynthesis